MSRTIRRSAVELDRRASILPPRIYLRSLLRRFLVGKDGRRRPRLLSDESRDEFTGSAEAGDRRLHSGNRPCTSSPSFRVAAGSPTSVDRYAVSPASKSLNFGQYPREAPTVLSPRPTTAGPVLYFQVPDEATTVSQERRCEPTESCCIAACTWHAILVPRHSHIT